MFCQIDKSLKRCDKLNEMLCSYGYCVVDDFLEEDLLCCLRDELEFLDNSEWLEPSGNKLQLEEGEDNRIIINKPGVYERSIVKNNDLIAGEATLELVPNISEFYYQRERIVHCLSNNTKLSVTGLDQVKLARIKEGGAFMVHTDTTPKKDRVLTVTLYLNSTKSNYNPEADGGQLRLYPISPQCVPTVVDIYPTFGRAVVFSSNNVPHRVMPSKTQCRYCISMFFYGDSSVPEPEVSTSDLSTIISPSTTGNIIFDMLKSRFVTTNGECEKEDLIAFIMNVKQRYPEVLSALIHTEEYYLSIAQAFSSDFIENCDSFEDVLGQVKDQNVRESMAFFNKKCLNLGDKMDDILCSYIDKARAHLKTELKSPADVS